MYILFHNTLADSIPYSILDNNIKSPDYNTTGWLPSLEDSLEHANKEEYITYWDVNKSSTKCGRIQVVGTFETLPTIEESHQHYPEIFI